MDIIITLLIALLVFAVVWYVIGRLSLPEPVRMIAIVVMAIIALIWLLRLLPGSHLLG